MSLAFSNAGSKVVDRERLGRGGRRDERDGGEIDREAKKRVWVKKTNENKGMKGKKKKQHKCIDVNNSVLRKDKASTITSEKHGRPHSRVHCEFRRAAHH